MTNTIKIGKWIESESRDINRCPSYYAADYEIIRTKPGEYPLFLRFVGGFVIPMPEWLLSKVDGERIDGALFSGFGGINYAKTDLPNEPTTYNIQLYRYMLKDLVESGKVVLDQGREWLLDDIPWKNEMAPKTWDEVN